MSRSLSFRHLAALYGLDPDVGLFRALRFFWFRDPAGQPLLAFLCAFARDPLLRATFPVIVSAEYGAEIAPKDMERQIETRYPTRFSQATLSSAARNTLASWTASGHLTRGRTKRRSKPAATAGSAAYALLLAYLEGLRGQMLFEAEYVRLLDLSLPEVIELAEEASRRGWIVFKRVADVIEVLFPKLIPGLEGELVHEQA